MGMNSIGYLSYKSNVIFNSYLNIFTGSLKFNHNKKDFLCIFLYVLTICSISITTSFLSFTKIENTLLYQLSEQKLRYIFYFLETAKYGITKCSVLVLMMYSSLVVRQQLNGKYFLVP
jgi:hypothetical protein